MKFIRKFATKDEYNAFLLSSEIITLNVSFIDETQEVRYTPRSLPPSEYPLFMIAVEDMTVSFSRDNLLYSTNNKDWISLPTGTATPTINAGGRIYFKAASRVTPDANNGIGTFTINGKCIVSGNVMSMLYGDDYQNESNTLPDYAFYKLFSGASNLLSAKSLVLPKKSSVRSFAFMFESCTNLIEGPDILAETLANKSCEDMFVHCSSLAIHPEIAATTIDQYSCGAMFNNCASLQETCELKAKTLLNGCYNYMYYGCRNLRLIKAYFTTTPTTSFTKEWVSGVASTGTFVKSAEATWNVTGVNGVPAGWTIETATE